MIRDPDRLLGRLLVGYYGLIEAVHLVVLARAALIMLQTGRVPFPAPSPPGGWSAQAVHFLVGMGVFDAFFAVASLVFVTGFLRRARWRLGLGLVTLTAAMSSAFWFGYGTLLSGAWTNNLPAYLVLAVVALPVEVLFVLVCYWAIVLGR